MLRRKRQWKGQWPATSLFLRHTRMWHADMWLARGLSSLYDLLLYPIPNLNQFLFSVKKKKVATHRGTLSNHIKVWNFKDAAPTATEARLPSAAWVVLCTPASLIEDPDECVGSGADTRTVNLGFLTLAWLSWGGWLWGVSICVWNRSPKRKHIQVTWTNTSAVTPEPSAGLPGSPAPSVVQSSGPSTRTYATALARLKVGPSWLVPWNGSFFQEP